MSLTPHPSLRSRKGLRRVSKRRAALLPAYRAKVRAWLVDKYCVECQRQGRLTAAEGGPHHKLGRIGPRLMDETTWLPVCNFHHRKIERQRKWARAMGYSCDRLSAVAKQAGMASVSGDASPPSPDPLA